MKDKTYQKILFLSGCILTFLLVCLFDTYTNKQQTILERIEQTINTGLSKLGNEEGSLGNAEKEAAGENKKEKQTVNANSDNVKQLNSTEENLTKSSSEAADVKNESDKAADSNEKNTSSSNPAIRVLIKTDNYGGEYHNSVTLTCTSDYVIQYGEETENHLGSEPLTLTMDSGYFSGDVIRIQPTAEEGEVVLNGLQRGYENPSYYGNFEIIKREQGLLVVNELPLETYLKSVVPSEMPASYPLESLKAQAVCARSYALMQMDMKRAASFNADVDDSVSYQVYNNQSRNERSTQAVTETAGQVMKMEGELVDALYYSTSCGVDLTQDLSKETVFAAFMTTDNKLAYEASEPWYRWTAAFSLEEITRLANQWQEGVGTVTGLQIQDREQNGAIKTLIVEGENNNLEITGEYNVRKMLSPVNIAVMEQDGSKAEGMELLPSAFCYFTPNYDKDTLIGYSIIGGGYGHGKGLSQNGAKHMAEDGKSCKEILEFYYGDVEIETQ